MFWEWRVRLSRERDACCRCNGLAEIIEFYIISRVVMGSPPFPSDHLFKDQPNIRATLFACSVTIVLRHTSCELLLFCQFSRNTSFSCFRSSGRSCQTTSMGHFMTRDVTQSAVLDADYYVGEGRGCVDHNPRVTATHERRGGFFGSDVCSIPA